MKSLPFVLCISLFQVLVFSLCTAVDTISPTESISRFNTLVSSGGIFDLGLFSRGNSRAWYLGIWYKNFTDIVVWVANRENPVTGSDGVLTLTKNGSLVLLDKMNNTVWSPNSSTAVEDPVEQLLETGNFVVGDKATVGSESYVWQSFDFPSDTLLSRMKIGWDFRTGLNKFFTSWKNSSDPSLGEYTYGIFDLYLPQLVLAKGSDKKIRSGPWNGVRFTGFPIPSNEIMTGSYVYDTNELYYTVQTKGNSLMTRLQLTESGDLLRLVLNEEGTEWGVMYNMLYDRCDKYAECGANGICKINNSPICDCLEGFVPKSQQVGAQRRYNWIARREKGFWNFKMYNCRIFGSTRAWTPKNVGRVLEELFLCCLFILQSWRHRLSDVV